MTWAGQRRALIIAIVGGVLLIALSALAFSIWYETPTCTDRTQNQDELGVDCGGPCSTLCAAQVSQPASVRFARAFTPQSGRTDVIAYVDNPNSNAAARGAPFVIEVFDASRRLIAKRTVTVDLPPSSTVPVYVPDIAPRGSVPAQAFLTPAPEGIVWTRPTVRLIVPDIEGIEVTEGERPRVTAVLVNPLAVPYYDLALVATVFDANGTAVAASQTIVLHLPSQGEAQAVFTWNEPFETAVARVEILPVPELR